MYFSYDSSDQRVRKPLQNRTAILGRRLVASSGRSILYVFDSLDIRGTVFTPSHVRDGNASYVVNNTTDIRYRLYGVVVHVCTMTCCLIALTPQQNSNGEAARFSLSSESPWLRECRARQAHELAH